MGRMARSGWDRQHTGRTAGGLSFMNLEILLSGIYRRVWWLSQVLPEPEKLFIQHREIRTAYWFQMLTLRDVTAAGEPGYRKLQPGVRKLPNI
jgi:hypothetical protein